jgi:DNA-binding response OmpR family regulator
VVEDDADMATVICDFLDATGGFRVEHVEDAAAALEVYRRQSYDLLIVDDLMPGMDGIQLLAALRESGGNTPAILMSGDPTIADTIKSGDTAFLAKPFSMSRLLEETAKSLRAPSSGRAG